MNALQVQRGEITEAPAALPVFIDADKLLPEEVRRYLARYGSPIGNALLKEIRDLREQLQSVRRENDALRRRLRDQRGLFDE